MKHLLSQQFAQYNAVEMSASYEQQARDIGSVSDRVNAKERFVRRVTATRTLDSLHFFVIQLLTCVQRSATSCYDSKMSVPSSGTKH